MQAQGLTEAEAAARLAKYGTNALPEAPRGTIAATFLRQFLSPLIYLLLASAVISAFVSDIEDAIFIGAVLLLNGIVGTIQEYSAERAAQALKKFELTTATVVRDGVRRDIDARLLVPGDHVVLDAGRRVPADIRLLSADGLRSDESMLTGESEPVRKIASGVASADTRAANVFAGAMITRGSGAGNVIGTGSSTELGKIAASLSGRPAAKPPLLLRLERFSRTLAIGILIGILVTVAAGLMHGIAPSELFMASVGLAVSAIPEGLPVAITVTLAIATRRMARHHVIMRNMPAIESLGSCTMIASDKTGTLTMNELTVTDVMLPDGTHVSLEDRSGSDGETDREVAKTREKMASLLRAAVLPNEASLVEDGGDIVGSGDAVDLALLKAARRGGVAQEGVRDGHPLIARIVYEPEIRYAASFHADGDGAVRIFVKGAPETLIAMADTMMSDGVPATADRQALLRQKEEMAAHGLRVLAFAEGRIGADAGPDFGHRHLAGLTFLGLAGMKDPIRPEVPAALAACRAAGIGVAMITGDDPLTAAAVARDAGLDPGPKAVTGAELAAAAVQGEPALDALTRQTRVYARVEPLQKLAIVESLARNGHIVAVTGDGINDAPALKHAHVGVAMGGKGTDIARESADIILTDDNFASIVAGIREGRVAYGNIRKVVFMLVATGVAEVLLFLLTVPFALPMPLLAVQLLWLNLVTNGIQDVMLAAEKPEGDELARPPRRPDEPLFDRTMIRRIILSALFMAASAIGLFLWNLNGGLPLRDARSDLLLQFVIFENVLTLCARSERRSLFGGGFFSNPMLLLGVAVTQALQIGAMYLPVLNETLEIKPTTLQQWLVLLAPALILLVLLELDKIWTRRTERNGPGAAPATG